MRTSLQTHSGHYLCAEPDGRVVADRTEAASWETWDVEPQAVGLVALRSAHGRYLCAEPDGSVIADREWIRSWEVWRVVPMVGGLAFCSAHGRYLVAEDGGGGLVRANRESAGIWETFAASDPTEHPDPSGPLTRLRVEDNRRYFANDAGRFDWREISAFSLLSRLLTGEDDYVRSWLQKRRAEGFTITRVILTLDGGYWHDQCPAGRSFRCAPDMAGYWGSLESLARMHADAGLYMRVCFLGALEPFGGVWHPDRRDVYEGSVRTKAEQFVVEAAQLLHSHAHVVGELANEPTEIGMRNTWDNGALVSLGQKVKAVAPSMLLCGGESNDARGVCAPFDFADAHLDRSRGVEGWQWVKRSGEQHVIDQDVMPFVSGEPINMGENRVDGRTGDVEPQPSVCFGVAAVSRSRRMGGVCFHWDGGLWTTEPQDITQRCLAAWHAGFNAFPMLTDSVWRGHWAESYWKRAEWPENDDPDAVTDHVRREVGPWRAFGCGPYSIVFPCGQGWDYTHGLSGPATQIAEQTDGAFKSAVYRRG